MPVVSHRLKTLPSYMLTRHRKHLSCIQSYQGKWNYLINAAIKFLGNYSGLQRIRVPFKSIYYFAIHFWELDFKDRFQIRISLPKALQKSLDFELMNGYLYFCFDNGVPVYWLVQDMYEWERTLFLVENMESNPDEDLEAFLIKVLIEMEDGWFAFQSDPQSYALPMHIDLAGVANNGVFQGFSTENVLKYIFRAFLITLPNNCTCPEEVNKEEVIVTLRQILNLGLMGLTVTEKVFFVLDPEDRVFRFRYDTLTKPKEYYAKFNPITLPILTATQPSEAGLVANSIERVVAESGGADMALMDNSSNPSGQIASGNGGAGGTLARNLNANRAPVIFHTSEYQFVRAENVRQFYVKQRCEDNTFRVLLEIKDFLEKWQALVFCRHELVARLVPGYLKQFDVNCAYFGENTSIPLKYNSGEVRMLFLTEEQTRGPVALRKAPTLINYNFPESVESYTYRSQFVGYTGPADTTIVGEDSPLLLILSFVGSLDEQIVQNLLQMTDIQQLNYEDCD